MTTIIIGAGVDKSEGLNLPLATELIPQISKFLKDDPVGIEVEAAIRGSLKGLRFSYETFIKQAIEKMASGFHTEIATIKAGIVSELQSGQLTDSQNKVGNLVFKLLDKIEGLKNNAKLDEETAEMIRSFIPGIAIEDENLVELEKLTFSGTFNLVMQHVFKQSLEDPNHPILKLVYKNFMDLENLMMKYFFGFYTNQDSDIRNYLYVAWTLWAYLKHKESEVNLEPNRYPFYSAIPVDWNIITFNYTKFGRTVNPNTVYFHGSLQRFIRLDNRTLLDIDNYENLNLAQFIIEKVRPNLHFDSKHKKFVIPDIIPPIKLKPVLSNQYIDIWYKGKKMIDESSTLIIAGYSFNYADEHFNDIIRKNREKRILIIDPNIDFIINNLKPITNAGPEDYSENSVQEKPSKQSGNLTLIKARANEISLSALQ